MKNASIGTLVREEGLTLYYKTTSPFNYMAQTDKIKEVEIRFFDKRKISSKQRARVYATLGDIADHLGYPPEELKEIMKYRYIASTGDKYFSFSDCSITTARHFISYIIDFALEWSIPLMDFAINRTDDINAYLYSCLIHRRCAICGLEAHLHHVTAVGMGRNRREIVHLGMDVMALCPAHHDECHTVGQAVFDEKWKVFGLKANEEICEKWALRR